MSPVANPQSTKGHLPRLEPPHYRGNAFVHWTHTTEGRANAWSCVPRHTLASAATNPPPVAALARAWTLPEIANQTRELILHACHQYSLVCPIYCLMPDHIHIVWIGISPASDQLLATRFFRKHINRMVAPAVLQKQPYDHVLREHERERNAFASVCHYIAQNPVRNGLCENWHEYPSTGCVVPGYPEMETRDSDYWFRFWRVYAHLTENDAGG